MPLKTSSDPFTMCLTCAARDRLPCCSSCCVTSCSGQSLPAISRPPQRQDFGSLKGKRMLHSHKFQWDVQPKVLKWHGSSQNDIFKAQIMSLSSSFINADSHAVASQNISVFTQQNNFSLLLMIVISGVLSTIRL